MLKLPSSLSARFAHSATRVARKLWASSSAASHHSVPASEPPKLQSLSSVTFNTIYTTSRAAVTAAWRSLKPVATRSLSQARLTSSASSTALPARSLAHRALKTQYRWYASKAWDKAMAPPQGGNGITAWAKMLVRLGVVLVNASAIWHLHTEIHKDNPTYVSYMAFVPLLDWIPMLDLAGLERAWALLPMGCIAVVYLMRAVTPSMLLMLAIPGPLLALELYRNYHLLGHFEQGNWISLVLWTIFRFEWLFLSQLCILGPDRYQLVPHHQATFSESFKQTAERLDQSLISPEIVHPYNFPFRIASFLWLHIPGFQQLRHQIPSSWNLSGLDSLPEDIYGRITGSGATSSSTDSAPTLEGDDHDADQQKQEKSN